MKTHNPPKLSLRNRSKSVPGSLSFFKLAAGLKSKSQACGLALLLLTIVLGSTGCGSGLQKDAPNGSPESYGSVTGEQLSGTRCSYVPEHHDFDFVWSFGSDTFLVKGDEIAPDLLETLLGPGATAKRIEGTWSIDHGKIELVVESGDKNQKARKPKLPIYSTGVIRIETAQRQYVFSK